MGNTKACAALTFDNLYSFDVQTSVILELQYNTWDTPDASGSQHTSLSSLHPFGVSSLEFGRGSSVIRSCLSCKAL